MARRPVADLNIVPMVPGRGRHEPPKALDQTEARAWNDIIDALPGQWVDLAGQVILRRAAAQIRSLGALKLLCPLGDSRLAVRSLVLVDDALARGLVQLH